MSTHFSSALTAAHDAAATQHHPAGTLYMVATPIGNLADISLRALHVLSVCDTLACEDTRHSQTLLRSYGIERNANQWLAVHQHNETQAAQEVIQRLQAGQRVAYVSDAGTPAISDPGARLAWQVQAAGFRVIPLPGASSVTALLSVCGSFTADASEFVFVGFLPSKATERERAVQLLASDGRTQVLLEAPHRIEALATSLANLGERMVTVGRELTKQFEEIATIPAKALSDWIQANQQRTRGEFALVVHAQTVVNDPIAVHDKMLKLLMQEVPLKTAVRLTAELTGESRNLLYDRALALKNTDT
ncbi:MAG: 16S rRNA (cytidine(1402)-2'-O)-methyltransferase [Betaproteobacteria bacterium]|nr:16S rRNA (cytidine(1402)-2'-O)-methyltransferase [Betaproteobacteria bacterium]